MKQERRKGHPAFRRIVPKASRTVLVEPRQRCPKDDVDLVPKPTRPAEKTVVDLVFTKSGCRKTVTKYVGIKSRCPKCGEHYNPASIGGIRTPLVMAFKPGQSTRESSSDCPMKSSLR